MKTLEDDDIMWFGKYNGQPLADIDAGYLIWLWNNGLKNSHQEDTDNGALSRWIYKQAHNLQREHPDKIMDKKP